MNKRQKDALSEYPEHEKLLAIEEIALSCGEFLDWLKGQVQLCVYHKHAAGCYDEGGHPTECDYTEDMLQPVNNSIQDWLAEYFNINQEKLEAEKREMLALLRKGVA